MAKYGFVYLLSNPSMPNLYKIGYTDRSPTQRCEELSSATACPTPFVLLMYIETYSPQETEQEIHKHYSDYRVNGAREFFKFDEEFLYMDVIIQIQDWGINQVETNELQSSRYLFSRQKDIDAGIYVEPKGFY